MSSIRFKKTAPVEGPLTLVPIVMTAFDDYGPIAAVPIPAAMPAAVMVTELGPCTAKIVAVTELAPITIAAHANANTEIISASYGRCRNGDSCQRCKRKTKFPHFHPLRSCPIQNGGTESLFLRKMVFQ
jgi:hypothetical protein